ncbi:Arc family DNA-binding protein [Acinetobacter sp. SCLZS86]|uniref:Arc family DNA-binding protein n=1 Tax=Acinetobacter sp. SCLZS86 TaxID=2908637 RepID=UPI001F4299E5|nr:Arc family DNA-binding protein [Acinetobacter sp. SCLZS86]UIZ56281.1 Arc family DNA-binding protein [Acinetobacter sp. SCLZS86]
MVRNDQQVNVRMPQEIVEELKIQAIKNRRSLTAQLNKIVEDWLREQKQQESAKA